MKKSLLFLLLVSFSQIIFAQCPRAGIISDYNNIYLPSAVSTTDLNWTGNSATCTAGTISDTALNRSLRRINYYRNLVGLGDTMVYDTTYSRKCQEAALMMTANNALNHTPPTSWLCYTADGATAAGSSNLALGSHSSGSISAFMSDNGTGNSAAGHRRWLLYSRASVYGMGSTTNACAIWVFGPTIPTPAISFIAFPSEGFFPAPLLPSSGRWSFGKPNADFSSAVVTMTDENGANISCTQEAIANGYGDNTLVWIPSGINSAGPTDTKYTVNIDSVMVSGNYVSFNYDVIIAQPVHPPTCAPNNHWSETDCACMPNTGIEEINTNEISVVSPFTDKLILRNNSKTINEIRIVNYSSSLVATRKINGSESTLEWNTSNWVAGIYFIISIDTNGSVKQKKIVKL